MLLRFIVVLAGWPVAMALGPGPGPGPASGTFAPPHLQSLKSQTKDLFLHGWNSYLQHGFPADEVRPMSCAPYGPSLDQSDITRNDVMGNVSSTLLDNIDTLILMEQWTHLETSLAYLKARQHQLFDSDVVVQVFEMTIRSLGGLLSAHLLLSDLVLDSAEFKTIQEDYDGFLLDMAYSLGLKLIPAFKTSSHIPVPRTNLRRGVISVPYNLQLETCTSGATTPVLEFTLLSKLTGDPQFEYYTQMTFWTIWGSRLALDLVPMTILPLQSEWKDSISGIGASIDSFYEYSVKFSILFNDESMWLVFKKSYRALMTHLAKGPADKFRSLIFANIGFEDGLDATIWIDSLGAFWAGVQVLAGRVSDAIGSHLVYLKLWDYFDLVPERWNCLLPRAKLDASTDKLGAVVGLEWYPLRPEFIESTYYLYRATRDPMYLNIGERVLELFQTTFKAKCGFKGYQDIRTGEFQDRMESFVLSETLKYLYLLFDEGDEVLVHQKGMERKNWVFSTEGHPLWYHKGLGRLGLAKGRLGQAQADLDLDKLEALKAAAGPSTGPGPGLDPFELRFYTCETNPFASTSSLLGVGTKLSKETKETKETKLSLSKGYKGFNLASKLSSFLKSSYYSMSNLFNLDYEFSQYLLKPPYQSNTAIELSSNFYDKYTMFSGLFQCPQQPTTSRFDLFLGNKSVIIDRKMEQWGRNYYVPVFKDLRLTLEMLVPGKVDLFYQIVPDLDVDLDGPSSALASQARRTKGQASQVIRILKINGVYIEQGLVVFVDWFSTVEGTGIGIVEDRMLINGYVVENLEVLALSTAR